MCRTADATLRFDQASNDMKSLKDSFQEEYRLFMHIYAIQSQGIRTGYQSGVATVQCHPWCPDGERRAECFGSALAYEQGCTAASAGSTDCSLR